MTKDYDIMQLEKTNRMNDLFQFYATLLTEKQMNYMELYYADDYSLGEIAEYYNVSRQAVYDNIKRTEHILESYEKKLHLYSDFIIRSQLLTELQMYVTKQYQDPKLMRYIEQLIELDED